MDRTWRIPQPPLHSPEGSILIWTDTGPAWLPPGPAGSVLQSDGTAPVWVTPPPTYGHATYGSQTYS